MFLSIHTNARIHKLDVRRRHRIRLQIIDCNYPQFSASLVTLADLASGHEIRHRSVHHMAVGQDADSHLAVHESRRFRGVEGRIVRGWPGKVRRPIPLISLLIVNSSPLFCIFIHSFIHSVHTKISDMYLSNCDTTIYRHIVQFHLRCIVDRRTRVLGTNLFSARYNARGFDLNRNFPDYFKQNNKWSQPETEAVKEWVSKIQFVLSGSLHGGALVASYPFDNTPNSSKSKWLLYRYAVY